MQFLNLKEQPNLKLELSDGDVILTRRFIPAILTQEHDDAVQNLTDNLNSKKITFLDYLDKYLTLTCEGYDKSLLSKVSNYDLLSLLTAVNNMLRFDRATEKKSE